MPSLNPKALRPFVRAALREDAAHRDATSRAVIPSAARIRARIIARQRGIAAGVKLAALVFTTADRSVRCRPRVASGAAVSPGQTLLTVEGRARAVFAAERTALNCLMHLSGIATLTRAYVDRVRGTRAAILDTRKTLPGLRALQKYAVRAGGGHSHRADLSQAVLIKTNHLRALRGGKFGVRNAEFGATIQEAITRAKRLHPRRFVEIEVANMREFTAALRARPDAMLLDNWSLRNIKRAVRLRDAAFRTPHSALPLEVSGGVTLDNVRAIARTGVDRLSIGRLTHSAPSLDCSLQVM